MNLQLNIDEIKKSYKFNLQGKTLTHTKGKKIVILPYDTRFKENREKIQEFKGVIGAFSRDIT